MCFVKREVEVFTKIKFKEGSNSDFDIALRKIKLKKGEKEIKTDMPLFFLIAISVSIFVTFLVF